MKYFDFTLPSPAENLACDEALLDLCESGLEAEILRFWEPQAPFVVAGYANRVAREVDLAACQKLGIPVFRRCTGGGTVVQGPGCLNYSLILQIDRPYPMALPPAVSLVGKPAATPGLPTACPLQSITGTNMLVLERQRAAIQSLFQTPVQILGHTDLATGSLKFSGNAQRRLKKCLIFHGTFLLHFDISLAEKILPMPSKQPRYRQGRSHSDFMANLEIKPHDVKTALRKVWEVEEELSRVPEEIIRELVVEKYSTEAWNLKF